MNSDQIWIPRATDTIRDPNVIEKKEGTVEPPDKQQLNFMQHFYGQSHSTKIWHCQSLSSSYPQNLITGSTLGA